MHGILFRAFNIPERLCFQMEWWWSMYISQHAGPPTRGDPDAPSRLPNSLRSRLAVGRKISLLFLIFFPDAGGAGRQTQTRPDKTFKERSSGRCGVSASRSWLLVLCLCGSCHAPLKISDDVYYAWCAADSAAAQEMCSLWVDASRTFQPLRQSLRTFEASDLKWRWNKLNRYLNPKYAG